MYEGYLDSVMCMLSHLGTEGRSTNNSSVGNFIEEMAAVKYNELFWKHRKTRHFIQNKIYFAKISKSFSDLIKVGSCNNDVKICAAL